MGFGLRPAGKEGVWGRVTSTLDWCEENYIVTDFVAEFWNTVSCVFHLIAMTEGIYSLRRLNVPLSEYSLYLMFACIGVIGIGSILFHATLQFHSQMLDELPMLYATTLTVFCMLRIFPSSRVNVLCLGLGLTAYSLLVTFFYLSFPNPVYHEIAFGFLVVTMVFLSPLQISHLSKQQPHLRKTPLLNTLWTLYYASIVSFASGFVLWLSENNRCEWFRSTRIRIGYPWRVLLEFHVWWHLGSSLSIYTVALRVSLMTVLSHGGKKVALRIQKEVEVWWMFGFVPRIHRTIAEDGGLIARKLA
ncbi:ceramidase [Chytriomyces sp. MP71]|nr:ceramidase [Chytriomyces sp. MP71]